MFKYSLAFLVVLFNSLCCLGAVTPERELELRTLADDPASDLRYLSEEEKAYLRGYLNEAPEEQAPIVPHMGLEDLHLLQVGDPMVIQKMIADFNSTGGFDPAILYSGQPIFIEFLAPSIFAEEPYEITGDDIQVVPPSYGNARVIQELLKTCPQLSGLVREWAARMDNISDLRLRAALRTWWPENKRFFKEHNYAAVQPGTSDPPVAATPASSGTVPVPQATLSPSSVPPKAGIFSSTGTEAKSEGSWVGWAVAVSFFVILAGLGGYFGRKGRKGS